MLNKAAEALFPPFRWRVLLLRRRIELGAVNGTEMAFCVHRRGAALSSVSMLSEWVGPPVCSLQRGLGLIRDDLLPVLSRHQKFRILISCFPRCGSHPTLAPEGKAQ